MDAAARSLLAALLERPADEATRLVLADCLEEQGDARHVGLRTLRPRARCRLLPLEIDGPPEQEFWSDQPDRIIVPQPWEFHAGFGDALHAARTDALDAPVGVRIFFPASSLPSGPALLDVDISYRGSWGWSPVVGRSPVVFADGIGFEIRGEGVVQITSRYGHYALLATLTGAHIGWRGLIGELFPEGTQPGFCG